MHNRVVRLLLSLIGPLFSLVSFGAVPSIDVVIEPTILVECPTGTHWDGTRCR
jgi:hypothetical protein